MYCWDSSTSPSLPLSRGVGEVTRRRGPVCSANLTTTAKRERETGSDGHGRGERACGGGVEEERSDRGKREHDGVEMPYPRARRGVTHPIASRGPGNTAGWVLSVCCVPRGARCTLAPMCSRLLPFLSVMTETVHMPPLRDGFILRPHPPAACRKTQEQLSPLVQSCQRLRHLFLNA